MTPEITGLIKKKAKKYAQFKVKGPTAWTDRWPKKEQGYYDGQIEAIETMIGFVEWIRKNYTDGFDGTWHKEIEPCVYQSFTTIELLKTFFKL